MRRLIFAGLVTLFAWAAASLPPAEAAKPASCDAARCLACPEGFRLLLKPGNCCRCVPNP